MSVQTSASRPAGKSVGAATVGLVVTLLIFVGVFLAFLIAPLLLLGVAFLGYLIMRPRSDQHQSSGPASAAGQSPTTASEPAPSDHDDHAVPSAPHRRRRRLAAPRHPRGHLPHLPGDAVRLPRGPRPGGRRRRRRLHHRARRRRAPRPPGHPGQATPPTRSARSSTRPTRPSRPRSSRPRPAGPACRWLRCSPAAAWSPTSSCSARCSSTPAPATRSGDILVSHESISEDVLVAALSEMHQLQRVGLADFEPDYDVSPPAPRAAGPPPPGDPGRRDRGRRAPGRRPTAVRRGRRRGRRRARRALPPAAGQPHRPRPADPAGPQLPLRRRLHAVPDGELPRRRRRTSSFSPAQKAFFIMAAVVASCCAR